MDHCYNRILKSFQSNSILLKIILINYDLISESGFIIQRWYLKENTIVMKHTLIYIYIYRERERERLYWWHGCVSTKLLGS